MTAPAAIEEFEIATAPWLWASWTCPQQQQFQTLWQPCHGAPAEVACLAPCLCPAWAPAAAPRAPIPACSHPPRCPAGSNAGLAQSCWTARTAASRPGDGTGVQSRGGTRAAAWGACRGRPAGVPGPTRWNWTLGVAAVGLGLARRMGALLGVRSCAAELRSWERLRRVGRGARGCAATKPRNDPRDKTRKTGRSCSSPEGRNSTASRCPMNAQLSRLTSVWNSSQSASQLPSRTATTPPPALVMEQARGQRGDSQP
mmetsp:Transcript_17475/g.38491  ORF Transcript_17475/g.38491 Transcript_17475/m.38491 type:complete len:257 (+) Transcript_17475:187-957(+)